MKARNCHYCNGTGREADPVAIGKMLRRERQKTKIRPVDLARKLGITRGYLCDLEMGRKAWSEEKIARYRQALKGISESR